MKTKLLLLNTLLAAALCVSCTSIEYLPKSSEHVGSSQYGSYIKIETTAHRFIAGELIAVDQDRLVIREHNRKEPYITIRTIAVPYQTISDFTLRYAEGKADGGAMPAVMVLSTISHGWFFVFTLPLNAITIGSVAASAKTEFEYAKHEISSDDLKMFARFPQGIPENIRLEDIK